MIIMIIIICVPSINVSCPSRAASGRTPFRTPRDRSHPGTDKKKTQKKKRLKEAILVKNKKNHVVVGKNKQKQQKQQKMTVSCERLVGHAIRS